jgi:hypothetical protein
VVRVRESEKFRRDYIERVLVSDVGPSSGHGQFRNLLELATTAAKERAEELNMSSEDVEDKIVEAVRLVDDIRYGLRPDLLYDLEETANYEKPEPDEDRRQDLQKVAPRRFKWN